MNCKDKVAIFHAVHILFIKASGGCSPAAATTTIPATISINEKEVLRHSCKVSVKDMDAKVRQELMKYRENQEPKKTVFWVVLPKATQHHVNPELRDRRYSPARVRVVEGQLPEKVLFSQAGYTDREITDGSDGCAQPIMPGSGEPGIVGERFIEVRQNQRANNR